MRTRTRRPNRVKPNQNKLPVHTTLAFHHLGLADGRDAQPSLGSVGRPNQAKQFQSGRNQRNLPIDIYEPSDIVTKTQKGQGISNRETRLKQRLKRSQNNDNNSSTTFRNFLNFKPLPSPSISNASKWQIAISSFESPNAERPLSGNQCNRVNSLDEIILEGGQDSYQKDDKKEQ